MLGAMSTASNPSRPPKVADEHIGFNGRLAALMTKAVGTMWVVYFTTAFVLVWMAVATWGPLHRLDPYPFAFLLFMGNVAQLLLVFVILVGQQVLGRFADRRSTRTFQDAETILEEVSKLHDHLAEQDELLGRGIGVVDSHHDHHPWIKERKFHRPARVRDQYVGANGRIAAALTEAVGTMWAFYAATVFQFGWIGLALGGVIRFDPFPFAFLLFISSLLQLVLMFVIMVGQDVLGRWGDQRSEQTFRDTEAILHECRQLQRHLTAQDAVIVKIAEFIEQHQATAS
jgi:uncharacterized membrane protein